MNVQTGYDKGYEEGNTAGFNNKLVKVREIRKSDSRRITIQGLPGFVLDNTDLKPTENSKVN